MKHGSYGRLLELFNLQDQFEKITRISKLERSYPNMPVKTLMEEYDTLLSRLNDSCDAIQLISHIDAADFPYFEVREASNIHTVLFPDLSLLNQAINSVLKQRLNNNFTVSLIDTLKELEAKKHEEKEDTAKVDSPNENSVDSESDALRSTIQYRSSMS